jgi:hypothetical protein
MATFGTPAGFRWSKYASKPKKKGKKSKGAGAKKGGGSKGNAWRAYVGGK